MEIEIKTPLRWPDGWRRTLIEKRSANKSWKKPLSFYTSGIGRELERMKATKIVLTCNEAVLEGRDPGAAVWFQMPTDQNFEWQTGLHIDNPLPTIAEIDEHYKELAKKVHPDSAGDKADTKMFMRLTEWRQQAIEYARRGGDARTVEHCIPCDSFTQARSNVAGIRFALSYFRGLERVGIPAIVDRIMERAFKQMLSEGDHVTAAASR
jgi:hypothetical protein